MCRFSLDCSRVASISSLAKAFGTPVAVLAGSHALVDRFERFSACRMHCSQPSEANIAAAEHALDSNDRIGEELRRKLHLLVAHFRRYGQSSGLVLGTGTFPVQSVQLRSVGEAVRAQRVLSMRGIHCFAHQSRHGGARLGFIVTTSHCASEIEHAVDEITAVTVASRSGAFR